MSVRQDQTVDEPATPLLLLERWRSWSILQTAESAGVGFINHRGRPPSAPRESPTQTGKHDENSWSAYGVSANSRHNMPSRTVICALAPHWLGGSSSECWVVGEVFGRSVNLLTKFTEEISLKPDYGITWTKDSQRTLNVRKRKMKRTIWTTLV